MLVIARHTPDFLVTTVVARRFGSLRLTDAGAASRSGDTGKEQMTSSLVLVLTRAMRRRSITRMGHAASLTAPPQCSASSDRTARTDEVIHSGWCEMSAVLTRWNTQDPYESYPHLFLVG